jgi:hypothetical protein
MPEYRATRFINVRQEDTYQLTAENDEDARKILLSSDNIDWNGNDIDFVIRLCDVNDEILALDRRMDGGAYETVHEEIELPGEMPYGGRSRDFVARVAALGEEGAYDDSIETLDRLIQEARALCASAIPADPDPWLSRLIQPAKE